MPPPPRICLTCHVIFISCLKNTAHLLEVSCYITELWCSLNRHLLLNNWWWRCIIILYCSVISPTKSVVKCIFSCYFRIQYIKYVGTKYFQIFDNTIIPIHFAETLHLLPWIEYHVRNTENVMMLRTGTCWQNEFRTLNTNRSCSNILPRLLMLPWSPYLFILYAWNATQTMEEWSCADPAVQYWANVLLSQWLMMLHTGMCWQEFRI